MFRRVQVRDESDTHPRRVSMLCTIFCQVGITKPTALGKICTKKSFGATQQRKIHFITLKLHKEQEIKIQATITNGTIQCSFTKKSPIV